MKRTNKAVNINTILVNGPGLSRLYEHSNTLLNLQSIIRVKLNSPVSDHIFVASVCQETVILYTDSPAWAARLRYHTQQLLDIIKNYSEFPQVNTVRIKVNPSLYKGKKEESPAGISSKSSEFLEQIANNMNDADLQSALLKVSKNRN